MASLPKKKPAPPQKSKKSVMRDKSGNPVLSVDKGKLKSSTPRRKASQYRGKGEALKGVQY